MAPRVLDSFAIRELNRLHENRAEGARVCARVDDWVSYRAPLFGSYNISQIYTYDHLGMRGKPGAAYLKWKLNSLGYRGPELRGDRFRIMCIGSSETFGLYEEENGEYPRQLEIELNRRVGREAVQVANVAYPGMSLGATLRRLPEILATVQPKVVTIYPSVAAYIDLRAIQPPRGPVTPPPEPGFEFRMQSRIETIAKQVVPAMLQNELRTWQIRQASRSTKVLDRIPDENVRRFRTDLTALVEQLKSRGLQVVLMTHATRFGKHVAPEERPMLIAWRKFYPMLREDGFLDMERRMNDAIRTVAAEYDTHLIDLAEKMPAGPEYFAEFVHFTDRGARTMATIIADHLLPEIRPQLPSASRKASGEEIRTAGKPAQSS
jgi:lysophospholipase L1-like esterase